MDCGPFLHANGFKTLWAGKRNCLDQCSTCNRVINCLQPGSALTE